MNIEDYQKENAELLQDNNAIRRTLRERAATLCEDWEEDSYCEGWREMEQGSQYCADAIRALEVER